MRAFLHHHRAFALALLALALCVKAAIPAGFMLSSSAERLVTVTICSDATGISEAIEIAIPAKHDKANDGTAKGSPCVYSGLAHAMLGGADAVLLALAFAVILVLGLAPMRRLPFANPFRIRPPMRAPPATA